MDHLHCAIERDSMRDAVHPSRFVTVVIWLICTLLIAAVLARKCAYVPLDPSEFATAPAR